MESCTSGFDASQRSNMAWFPWLRHSFWNEILRQGDWPLNNIHFIAFQELVCVAYQSIRLLYIFVLFQVDAFMDSALLSWVIPFRWPLRFLHSTFSGRSADGSSPTETGAGNRKGSEVRNQKAEKLDAKVWRCFFLSVFSRRFISLHTSAGIRFIPPLTFPSWRLCTSFPLLCSLVQRSWISSNMSPWLLIPVSPGLDTPRLSWGNLRTLLGCCGVTCARRTWRGTWSLTDFPLEKTFWFGFNLKVADSRQHAMERMSWLWTVDSVRGCLKGCIEASKSGGPRPFLIALVSQNYQRI